MAITYKKSHGPAQHLLSSISFLINSITNRWMPSRSVSSRPEE
jgi:hypothetical protein